MAHTLVVPLVTSELGAEVEPSCAVTLPLVGRSVAKPMEMAVGAPANDHDDGYQDGAERVPLQTSVPTCVFSAS